MTLPEFRARVVLEATISASEDPTKVIAALRTLMAEPAGSLTEGAQTVRLVTANVADLIPLRDQLRDRHVRSAARRRLLLSKEGDKASLMFNRQAAFAGIVALCGSPEESPLGPIYMTIESDRLDSAIDWLAAYEEG